MGMLQEDVRIQCPYCGESIHIYVDCSAGSQAYIEDCQVCCAPINLRLEIDTDFELLSVTALRDDE